MPINVGGTIYIPYYYLDANQNGGIQFGVYNGGQNRVHNTLTLYNSEPRNLTFDLRTGVSYDYYPDGAQQDPTAIIRNGQIYVSASSTCLLRPAVHLQQHPFGDKSYPLSASGTTPCPWTPSSNAANTSYLIQLQNYYRTAMGQGARGGPRRARPLQGESDRRGVRVYLAVRCTARRGRRSWTVAGQRLRRLLLFPAEVARRDELVRRAVGRGTWWG